jgi:DNA-binding NtrC family response regulator
MDAMTKRILIVDDEARVLLILHDTLQRLGTGFEVVTAQSSSEALKRARKEDFDLVITDLRMPGMDGIELTRALRAIQPEIRVVWITAYGCHKASADSVKLGVFRCLDKPLEIKQIRQVAQEALNRARIYGREESHSATGR